MRFLPLLLVLFLLSFQQAPLGSLRLPSYNARPFSINELNNCKAVVFVFLMPDCPFCQKYTKTLNELQKVYGHRGISFQGVITGDLYSEKEVKDFIKKYKISYPVLHDADKKLIRYYNLSVSPSVAVADLKGRLLYKGMIDNWPVSPGKTRQIITENYLDNVLQQIASDKIVTVKNTEAVGCIIE